MKFIVIRHGQTDWNLNRMIQGRSNIDLNQTGMNQAEAARDKIKNESIDMIYCSPLNRTKQTADILNKSKNIPIKYDERLIEISFGVNEGKIYGSYDYKGFWNVNAPHLYEGAENVNDLIKRVYSFIDEVKQTDVKAVLLVTHGGVCKAIKTYFEGIPENGELDEVKLENCGILEYEI